MDYDYLSHSGAIELARRLRRHWLDRGYNIKTTVEALRSSGCIDVYVVRSNLVSGMPPADTKIEFEAEAA